MKMKNCPTCQNEIPNDAPEGLCPHCLLGSVQEDPTSIASAPDITLIDKAFPQLTEFELIGQGGMGFIYKAEQPELDRTIALKILSPELGKDPAFTERFAREARVLGKLNHSHIVTIFEHGQNDGFFYLMMEYVDGVNLREAMSAQKFTPEQALAIIPDICDALQSAHDQGIWHRDIKPENILLDQDGKVKIADFGIARIIGDRGLNFTLTNTGNALGSVAYMSPEQHENPHNVDHRADIYSLGVVIYEMLTGELPLGRFPAPSERSNVDQRIDELVLKTLEKERELRQQSVSQVKTDFADVKHSKKPKFSINKTGNLTETTIATISLRALILYSTGFALFFAAGAFPSGNIQGILVTIAFLSGIIGFILIFIALGQMRRGEIPHGLRKTLRACLWLPVVFIIMSIIIFANSKPKPKTSEKNLKTEIHSIEKATAKRKINSSSATIQISPVINSPTSINNLESINKSFLQNQIALLQSGTIINKAIIDYKLEKLFNTNMENLSHEIKEAISIKAIRGTDLFDVEIFTDNQKKSQQICYALIQSYIALLDEKKEVKVITHQTDWAPEIAKVMKSRKLESTTIIKDVTQSSSLLTSEVKAKDIIIPHISTHKDLNVEDVIQQLRNLSEKYDLNTKNPKAKGVNIITKDFNPKEVKAGSMELRDVSLYILLEYFAQASGIVVEYRDAVIVLTKKPNK